MRGNRQKKSLGSFLIVIIVGSLLWWIFFRGSRDFISPLASDTINDSTTKVIFEGKKTKDESQLLQEIKDYVATQTGVYSVYVYDLTTNHGFGINETTILTAASVNKVPVLAALYFEAQRGEIDLDKRITIQAADIQNFGTGSIRYQGPGQVYSIKTLAQLMMEKSDNTAVYVLTTLIGEKRVQELVDEWGLTQTDIPNNKTSNADMAKLFTKMYKGQIANQALTTEMIGFMDDSDFEKRLPAELPKEIDVYHKIGNEIGNVHDVGIVAIPKNPYFIGILTNDIINEPQAETAIATISKMVYGFMKE